jgi:acetyl esterase/lipase
MTEDRSAAQHRGEAHAPTRHGFAAPNNLQDRLIEFGARWIVRPNLALPLPWRVKRRSFALAGRARPLVPGIRQERLKLAGRAAARYAPEAPEARLVWIHGGGFVVGSPSSHRGMLSHLARRLNAEVIAPRYRLAPEHPFPAAPDDIEAALEALAPSDGPLYLGGDSAGGTLALVALAFALRRGAPKIDGLFLISPAVDLDPARPFPKAQDLLFPRAMFDRIKAAYIAGADPRDPRLSPLHGRYAGAPPMLIQCCAGEYLQSDSEMLADRLSAQGVSVTLETYAALPHVFHFMAGGSPSADAALERAAAFLEAAS